MNSLQNSCKALLLLFVLVAGSCKHEPPAEPVDCGEATSIEEMMEWTYFKTGTYWIYREINTGVLDTCYVYYDYYGLSQGGNETFVYKIHSSNDGYTYEYWFNEGWSGHGSLKPECLIRVVDCDKYRPGDYLGGSHVFPFPLFVGNRCGQDNGVVYGLSTITEIKNNDSLPIGVLGNTIQIYQECSPQHSFRPSTYKLAKNVGIVRKTIPHVNEDWILISHSVIQ
jgi:hypothetical protein